jgi:hypothetical protein
MEQILLMLRTERQQAKQAARMGLAAGGYSDPVAAQRHAIHSWARAGSSALGPEAGAGPGQGQGATPPSQRHMLPASGAGEDYGALPGAGAAAQRAGWGNQGAGGAADGGAGPSPPTKRLRVDATGGAAASGVPDLGSARAPGPAAGAGGAAGEPSSWALTARHSGVAGLPEAGAGISNGMIGDGGPANENNLFAARIGPVAGGAAVMPGGLRGGGAQAQRFAPFTGAHTPLQLGSTVPPSALAAGMSIAEGHAGAAQLADAAISELRAWLQACFGHELSPGWRVTVAIRNGAGLKPVLQPQQRSPPAPAAEALMKVEAGADGDAAGTGMEVDQVKKEEHSNADVPTGAAQPPKPAEEGGAANQGGQQQQQQRHEGWVLSDGGMVEVTYVSPEGVACVDRLAVAINLGLLHPGQEPPDARWAPPAAVGLMHRLGPSLAGRLTGLAPAVLTVPQAPMDSAAAMEAAEVLSALAATDVRLESALNHIPVHPLAAMPALGVAVNGLAQKLVSAGAFAGLKRPLPGSEQTGGEAAAGGEAAGGGSITEQARALRGQLRALLSSAAAEGRRRQIPPSSAAGVTSSPVVGDALASNLFAATRSLLEERALLAQDPIQVLAEAAADAARGASRPDTAADIHDATAEGAGDTTGGAEGSGEGGGAATPGSGRAHSGAAPSGSTSGNPGDTTLRLARNDSSAVAFLARSLSAAGGGGAGAQGTSRAPAQQGVGAHTRAAAAAGYPPVSTGLGGRGGAGAGSAAAPQFRSGGAMVMRGSGPGQTAGGRAAFGVVETTSALAPLPVPLKKGPRMPRKRSTTAHSTLGAFMQWVSGSAPLSDQTAQLLLVMLSLPQSPALRHELPTADQVSLGVCCCEK